ncbi:MAG TPA: C1 family peptidase [Sphingomonadaceae bacterium]|nr:C1 family peptidase [Sphingomonadaceae bacterium]
MSITVLKDLRASFGPARDQDPRPTCMAFAASDAHAGARPGSDPLSVEWAYYHALKRDGVEPHQGVHFSTMLAALRGDGQPAEAQWPYIAELFTDFAAWKPPASADPIFRRESVPAKASVPDIVGQLDQDQPVLFTMSISPAFYRPDPTGLISANEPLMPKRVHALVAVGHGTRGVDQFVMVRNSWGEGWGLAGHAWMDTAYLAPRLLAAATMAGEP